MYSFPRSAWERTLFGALRLGRMDAERPEKWVPTQSIGTRNKGVRHMAQERVVEWLSS